MIVDTSALTAAAMDERDSEPLKLAMLRGGFIPAPVVFEFHRVMTRRGLQPSAAAEDFLNNLIAVALAVTPLTAADTDIAAAANIAHGSGDGRGGPLNLVDLMVYATAKRMREPILCTGLDFRATDAEIHPASRSW